MRAILARIAMITLLFSTASIERPSEALGSSRCPDGYHRSPSGDCENVSDLPDDLPRCPDGYHRSPSGDCESVQGGSSASESSSNNDDDDDDIDSVFDSSVGDNEIRGGNNNVENTNVNPSIQQQVGGQFLRYENPTLGISVQYPSDWQIEEEQGEQVTFVKEKVNEKNIVEFLVDVHELDSPDITLTEFVGNEISKKREERQGFNLIESTPVTISDGNIPAHMLVYTFVKEDEGRNGEINKISRIFAILGNKVYNIAYLAESDRYSTYLPVAQQMINSLKMDGLSNDNVEQIGSSDLSQSLPELKPKTTIGGESEAPSISEPETPPVTGDFVMKVQLEPHENEFARADGRYQVSDFAIAISNSSKICPVSNCVLDLDGGEMSGEVTPGERALDGKLRIETGDSTKIMDLYADLQTVEEHQEDGKTVRVIQGELRTSVGDFNKPNYQSLINGTLVPDGNDFILELIGTGESPFTYT